MKVSAIVFSKNRALQLDLLLKSIYSNFKECMEVDIIYKETEEHKDSYEKLKSEHQMKLAAPFVYFHKQGDNNFYQLIYNLVSEARTSHVVFFTDDDIVYRNVNIPDIALESILHTNFSCLSLRLGGNITKRQIGDFMYDEMIPNFSVSNNILIWDYTECNPCGYFGYPMSVDGHIFCKKKLLDILDKMDTRGQLETPNKFEELLVGFATDTGRYMISLSESCVVNSPNNRVQEEYKNRAGDHYSYCEDHLMNLYLVGTRIDLKSLDFSNVNCPHTEIKII